MESNKSVRIKYNQNNPDNFLNIKLEQDFDFLEVLSLKISQEDAYRLYTSNYGILVGRVLANDGFGIPNAKISIFIKNQNVNDGTNNSILYPYDSVSTKNSDNIRYNLLPSNKINNCYQNVGSFSPKRDLLDNNVLIEIFDEYYKYTTTTNESGDYMLFGVPTGQQQIHTDIDLSDIGVLSQSPRDMEYKGYNIKQFDSPNKFKSSTNLDSLSQIISENSTVFIYPFWGDNSEGEIAISKNDVKIQYKFEPTCVFMGSIFTDSVKSGINKTCKPSRTSGKMNEIIASQGSIEMIRKTIDNSIENFDINGNRLIDNNGVWCYQIPMNLDYVITDEYGNIVPTNDPTKGIPTRASVRFRITLDDNGDSFVQSKTGVYLIPNNPQSTSEEDYEFGISTKPVSFVNLLWNKVYSVKNYIPRIQKGDSIIGINTGSINVDSRNFNGLKSTNYHENNNPAPYNNIWIDINLRFMLICLITEIFIWVVSFVNDLIHSLNTALGWVGFNPFSLILVDSKIGGESCELLKSYEYFIPINIKPWSSDKEYDKNKALLVQGESRLKQLKDCIETDLASSNEVVNFDFTNDWLNGSLYSPRFLTKSKKNKKSGSLDSIYCGSYAINEYSNVHIIQTCAVSVDISGNTNSETKSKCDGSSPSNNDCYKKENDINFKKGIIKLSKDKQNYYYKSTEFTEGAIKYIQATDLILLGSLTDCDQDGIPKLHQLIPSTTFKLPPDVSDSEPSGYFSAYTYNDIVFNTPVLEFQKYSDLPTPPQYGTVSYLFKVNTVTSTGSTSTYYTYNTTGETYSVVTNISLYQRVVPITGNTWVSTGTTSDIIEISGIDWGTSLTGKPNYKNGLFVGIGCMSSDTYTKTCINASRLCELGVDFDETYDNNGTKIDVDGFISNEELSDSDARSMFSTLNINGLKTINVNGQKKYNFEYNYPDGFDGRLRNASIGDTSEYPGKSNDINSVDYNKFRFGSRYKSIPDLTLYYNFNSGNDYSFPKFENSFYFYFGIKPGFTALDSFNTQYFVPCSGVDTGNKNLFNLTTIADDGLCVDCTPQSVTTNVVTSILGYTATSGGVISSGCGEGVSDRGVCWSTSPNPTFDLSTKTFDGFSNGSFTSSITGLITGTTYYVRAYARNDIKTTYGNQKTFKTLSMPILSTVPINKTSTTDTVNLAYSGGNITDMGGSTIINRGVCWSTNPNPTISNSNTMDNSAGLTGTSYATLITSIAKDTTYYVRAFATNGFGTGYGNQIIFKLPSFTATLEIKENAGFCS